MFLSTTPDCGFAFDDSIWRRPRTTYIELGYFSGWIAQSIHGVSLATLIVEEVDIVILTSVTVLWRNWRGHTCQEKHALDYERYTYVLIGGTIFKRTWRPLVAEFVSISHASLVAKKWYVMYSEFPSPVEGYCEYGSLCEDAQVQ